MRKTLKGGMIHIFFSAGNHQNRNQFVQNTKVVTLTRTRILVQEFNNNEVILRNWQPLCHTQSRKN